MCSLHDLLNYEAPRGHSWHITSSHLISVVLYVTLRRSFLNFLQAKQRPICETSLEHYKHSVVAILMVKIPGLLKQNPECGVPSLRLIKKNLA